jgi:hypothetical protein
MLVKKLAVPLINDKILLQTEHCYIATTSISETAFDLVRTRISAKSKIEIVTGLDELTTPAVLRKIWRNYHERISLRIYTKNTFHANLYIFDLPFRKSVAFIGSGHLTLGGIKDGEELFYKITDAKEIENLKSWFTGYYEFAEEITENIVTEYESIYPVMRQREIASREEKEQMIALSTQGFNWDTIRFKNQYFKKEDYPVLGNAKASLQTTEVQAERNSLREKMLQLHEQIKKHMFSLRIHENSNEDKIVSSINPVDHSDQKLRSIHIAYGRREAELKKYSAIAKQDDFMTLQIKLLPRDVGIWLVVGKINGSKEDREYFKDQMVNETYRAEFLKLLQNLGTGYFIEIEGERKAIETFQTPEALWEFVKADDWRYYKFVIGRNYSPSAPELTNEKIGETIMKEADKLVLVYRHIIDKPI